MNSAANVDAYVDLVENPTPRSKRARIRRGVDFKDLQHHFR